MLTEDLQVMNPNEVDVRYWLREICIQLANVNGNLYALRNIVLTLETAELLDAPAAKLAAATPSK